MRVDCCLSGSASSLKKARPFWNTFLLLLILVYNLAIPAPSLADFAPAAVGHPSFGSSMDSDRVDTPLADITLAACPKASCIYLPWLTSPLPVRVVEVDYWNTKGDTYRIIGDTTAIYEYPVYNVMVKLRAFDSAGQFIGEYTGPTAFPATLPGQLNPFDIVSNISSAARSEVVIAGFELSSPVIYAPATVITTTEVLLNGTTVNALIRNDGLTPLTDVQAVAWSLDQYFNYANHGLEKVADTLLPGETVTYTKYFFNTFNPALIRVAAQGILQP